MKMNIIKNIVGEKLGHKMSFMLIVVNVNMACYFWRLPRDTTSKELNLKVSFK